MTQRSKHRLVTFPPLRFACRAVVTVTTNDAWRADDTAPSLLGPVLCDKRFNIRRDFLPALLQHD